MLAHLEEARGHEAANVSGLPFPLLGHGAEAQAARTQGGEASEAERGGDRGREGRAHGGGEGEA